MILRDSISSLLHSYTVAHRVSFFPLQRCVHVYQFLRSSTTPSVFFYLLHFAIWGCFNLFATFANISILSLNNYTHVRCNSLISCIEKTAKMMISCLFISTYLINFLIRIIEMRILQGLYAAKSVV